MSEKLDHAIEHGLAQQIIKDQWPEPEVFPDPEAALVSMARHYVDLCKGDVCPGCGKYSVPCVSGNETLRRTALNACDENEALRRQNAELRGFVRHKQGCAKVHASTELHEYLIGDVACDCGLDQALSTLPPAPGESDGREV